MLLSTFVAAFMLWYNAYQGVDFAVDKTMTLGKFLEDNYADLMKEIGRLALRGAWQAFSEGRYSDARPNLDLATCAYEDVLKRLETGLKAKVRVSLGITKPIIDARENLCFASLLLAIALRLIGDNGNAFKWAEKTYAYHEAYLVRWEQTESRNVAWYIQNHAVDTSGSTSPSGNGTLTPAEKNALYANIVANKNAMKQNFRALYDELFPGVI